MLGFLLFAHALTAWCTIQGACHVSSFASRPVKKNRILARAALSELQADVLMGVLKQHLANNASADTPLYMHLEAHML